MKRILFWTMVVSLIVWVGSAIIASRITTGDGELPWLSLYISGPAGLVCILTLIANLVMRLGRK